MDGVVCKVTFMSSQASVAVELGIYQSEVNIHHCLGSAKIKELHDLLINAFMDRKLLMMHFNNSPILRKKS